VKALRLLSLVVFALLTISRAAAQNTQPPLLIVPYHQETIVQYRDGKVTPLDNCTPKDETRVASAIAVSPSGWQYAFLTTAPNATSVATNIRICDLQTGQLISVTGQPQTQVAHSIPAWSPDGTMLAFLRLFQEQDRMEFVIYDLATRDAKVVYQREQSVSANSLPSQVIWGMLGAIAFNTNITDQTRPRVSEYIFYPQAFITQDKPDEAVPGLLDDVHDSIQEIIRADGAYSYVVSRYGQPDRLLDLATNQTSDLPGTLVKVSALAPQGAYAQVVSIGTHSQEWSVNGGSVSLALGIPAFNPDSLAVSPDGSQFAFITYEDYPYGGKVYIVTDPAALIASTGTSRIEGVTHITEFDAHFGEPGALSVYWGPSIMKLNE
jgi:hypothetical protein